MKRQFLISSIILLSIQTFALARTLYVPSRTYPNIQSAITAAVNGDVVIVMPGTYTGTGNVNLDFNGKAITVESEINPANPDPAIIAATIIDCGGQPASPTAGDSGAANRAFHFHLGEGNNSKVMGFTIRNGYARGPKGADGQFGYNGNSNGYLNMSLFVPLPICDNPNDCPPYALNGANATGDGYGGAILCEANSSPTIMYCVISDCTVTGAQGGKGADGQNGTWLYWPISDFNVVNGSLNANATPTSNPDGQWGGSGGNGSGNGYGGAIACRSSSSPYINNCTIINNFARGGSGGDGGNGGDAASTGSPPTYSGKESGGGNAGNSNGDGMGGVIYCDGNSSPIISNCIFGNNVATTGPRGTGGQTGAGNELALPNFPRAPAGSDGGVFSAGHIAGGAAYYVTGSRTTDINCTFTGNKAYKAYQYYNSYLGEDIWQYTSGGALYSDVSNVVNLDTCTFTSNLGGAVYCDFGCTVDINNTYDPNRNCSFSGNSETTSGGAVYIEDGCPHVSLRSCIFGGNSAYDDGGALECRSDANLINCSFSNNRAYGNNDGYGYGGAMDSYDPAGTTLTVDFNACSFTGNQSIYGGGFSSENFHNTSFTNCYFIGNTAQEGGGLDLVIGDFSVTGGVVKGNTATNGDGGGFDCIATTTDINGCTIMDNYADGNYPISGNGGAINFFGGYPAPMQKVFNCLITGNSAAVDGGAIFCNYAEPNIGNCTFNSDSAGGYGGAIFSDYASDPNITDSIFKGCNNHAIHEEVFGGNAIVRYSLFYNNPGGDYYDSNTGLTYTGAGDINSIPNGSNNLYGDPLFVTGPLGDYYLSQIAAGQSSNSPAVDNGSGTAVSLGLDTYTTRTDNVGDVGRVDIGYHYLKSTNVQTFNLTASVVGDHGSVAPTSGTYYAGTVVTLTAAPDSGWWIQAWTGTDDDSSTAKTNTVVMNSNKNVTVEFKQSQTLIVAAGGGQAGYYSTIQDAVGDANDGDTIVVYSGTYYGGYFAVSLYVDKSVTITSLHPDDPCYVATTIIDGYRQSPFVAGYTNDGVVFGPHTNADTIFNGFTIQNCGGKAGNGLAGDRTRNHPNGYDGESAAGAAIQVLYSGGPVIENCIIKDNVVIGGDGGDGSAADNTHNAGRGGWGGYAYGGAVYCDSYSSPTFINCQIIDNNAQGGNGGNGGNGTQFYGTANYGGNWSITGTPQYPVIDFDPNSLAQNYVTDEGLWEVWGYIGDYRWYSAYGAGVFCGTGSTVTFTNCTISGNHTIGGISGQGGKQPPSNRPFEPLIPYEIPTFGGGVYCAASSTITFTDCTITNNIVSEPNVNHNHLDPYPGHGGGVCAEDTAKLIFTNCTFSENSASVGGGTHFADANPTISDCNFVSNSAFQGGGLYGEHGPVSIIGCNIVNNEAVSDLNDTNSTILSDGGGLHLWATEANITDCNISGNQATDSGGGAFFGGENASSLTNCLLTNNTARYGGAITTNMFAQLTISNCTIAGNTGETYGGGLACSYESYVNIINSIIWGNVGVFGSQIAIGTSSEYDPAPSAVMVTYTDIGPRYDPNTFTVPIIADPFNSGSQSSDPNATLVNGQNIYGQFDAGQERVKVIVSMPEPVELKAATRWNSPESVARLRDEVAGRQSTVLSTLNPDEFALRYRYENQAGFSGEITRAGFEKLLSNPRVAHIEPVRKVCPVLRYAIPLANALEARQVYDGKGVAIAIVDTGIDYTHPMLGGGGFPNSKVIGGYDTADNKPDPMPVGTIPDVAHGTCCAGIAAGNLGDVGNYIGGVAPGAKLYALKASPDNEDYFLTDAELAAWDWCITHQNDDPNNPIKVMSNSWALSGVPFNDPCAADAYSPAHTALVESAVAAGITVLAAAGNDGFAGQGISWPAAISKVISVGAVYVPSDQVTSYSNTANILNILAPGDPIYTTDIVGAGGYDPGDYYPYFNGTSAACPFAAGCVADIQTAARAKLGRYLTPAEVKSLLILTGDPVTDTKVAITKPRVNLGMAIAGLEMAPIYVEGGCALNGWQAPDTNSYWCWDPNKWPNSHNIEDDPCFVVGYYLSHKAVGQLVDSKAIDAGSDLASHLGLDTYTTRVDGVPDDANVDMGYHYKWGVAPYELTIGVVGGNGAVSLLGEPNVYDVNVYDVNEYATVQLRAWPNLNYKVMKWTGTDDDNILDSNNTVTMYSDRTVTVEFSKEFCQLTIEAGPGGTVASPWSPNTYTVAGNTVVNLQAVPDNGYWVKGWSGTDNDTSTSLYNTVTVVSDKTVMVTFEQAQTYTVPGDYASIQQALDAVREGDTILLSPGTYTTSSGYLINNKNVTISGIAPDDPCVVAATAIEVVIGESGYIDNSAFTIYNVGPETVLNGITIRGVVYQGYDGLPGSRPGEDGGNGEHAFGGGILCYMASPTIKNCIIADCNVIGGSGGNGFNGSGSSPTDPNIYGTDGGWPGRAYGGGLACLVNSNPTVINCTFQNCSAIGGNGGDGGNGSTTEALWETYGVYAYGGRGGGWYYSNDIYPWNDKSRPWKNSSQGYNRYGPNLNSFYDFYNEYTGRGGAVFVGGQCSPKFIDCNFINSHSEGGTCGITGLDGWPPINRREPSIHYKIENFGGAVFCEANSSPIFTDCNFAGNTADTDYPSNNDGPYVSYGGAVAWETGADVNLKGCTFSNNLAATGGAIYWSDADAQIIDCNISDNNAYLGGGIFGTGSSSAVIHGCFIIGNAAGIAGNDVNGGQGGGIYSSSMESQITDCTITDNQAATSGGGILFSGATASTPTVKNCLVVDNQAGRDGGGLSVDWYATPLITNCTIVGNEATGNFGLPGKTGLGGGIYTGYYSHAVLRNSILWNNSALQGNALAVGTGFELDPGPSTVDVNYSDVDRRQANLFVDVGCTLYFGAGNIYVDPCFVTGPLGDYYLSQTATNEPNQTVNSPCVDKGSDLASRVGLCYIYTTRTDEVFDTKTVDIGYHYPLTHPRALCSFCDLNKDGIVNFDDFAILSQHWLNGNCSADNNWCGGADLTFDTYVNYDDLTFFIECWLAEDTNAPVPNPSEWKIVPYSTTVTAPYTVSMTAETAFDDWGGVVEYYFECVTGNDSNSGWDPNGTHISTNLSQGTVYGYRVKARNVRGNETLWSAASYVTAGACTTPPVTDPCAADPYKSTWDTPPYATGPNSICMVATTATGICGVAYYFECNDSNFSSGWQDSTTYVSTGLDPCTTYGYRVRTRDNAPNYGDWSDEAWATTLGAGQVLVTTPPTPNPMTWAIPPYANGPNSIYMVATTATDISGVEYYFACTSNSNYSSNPDPNVFQDSTIYQLTGVPDGSYTFVVRARDKLAHKTTGDSNAVTVNIKTTPPTPNPMTWAIQPYRTGAGSLSMTATTATDPTGVEYYFACTSNSSYDSGWQASTTYALSGLPNGIYTFVVRARDNSPNQNTTGDSSAVSVDLMPPLPNPSQWLVAPYQYDSNDGYYHHHMEAVITSDATTGGNNPCQYYFNFVGGGYGPHDSGWQSSNVYDYPVSVSSQYGVYRVKARDAVGNETGWSPEASTQ